MFSVFARRSATNEYPADTVGTTGQSELGHKDELFCQASVLPLECVLHSVFPLQSKKQYEKAFREAEKAQEMYKKADADINLSRAEVEKVTATRFEKRSPVHSNSWVSFLCIANSLFQAKNLSMNKQQMCEDCKNEYASELQKTNGAQKEHYDSLMPQIFQVSCSKEHPLRARQIRISPVLPNLYQPQTKPANNLLLPSTAVLLHCSIYKTWRSDEAVGFRVSSNRRQRSRGPSCPSSTPA